MCGLAGFLRDPCIGDEARLIANATRMANAIAHRGPDGSGVFCDPGCGVALAHRRLSIIDLSDAGKQPMASEDGRWVMVFNGEIYNYAELRQTLEAKGQAPRWRGHSDTEVLLACIVAWGFERTLQQANGMFAVAVWDCRERRLLLARDRMGEKPLYYGWQGEMFLFGSELKALAAHPAFERRLDRTALGLFLEFAYVPAPLSIFQGIRKLKAAHYVVVPWEGVRGVLADETAYWQLPLPEPVAIDEADAVDQLDALLRDSVAIRMRADVPMGSFLSGGVDSSTVTAVMQAQSANPVRSFSIGFRETGFDESRHAAQVAAHLGTAHTELEVTAEDALRVVPLLGQMFDEPFADPSQIPTYLLAKLTRQHVTVSLSGDAGDELFGGYTRYFTFDALWRQSRRVPQALRGTAASVLSALPLALWRHLPAIPSRLRREITAPRVRKLAAAMRSADKNAYYRALVRSWDASELLSGPMQPAPIFIDRYNLDRDFADPISGMSFIDEGTYLPDDILVKLDRATMAASLEGRIPMLDHRIVEFSARLPVALKCRNGVGKRVLRQVLDRYVPRTLIDRPKQGFGIPLAEWMRGHLRDWAEGLIFGETAMQDHIDMVRLGRLWRRHQAGEDHNQRLWCALMLLSWSREWKPL